jgi:hypothetical protein
MSAATAARPSRRWRSLPGAARAVIVIVALLIAVNVGLELVAASTRGADETAPTSSSFSTGSTGVAAWADLLRANGHVVRQRRGTLSPASGETVVVLDPDTVSAAEGRSLSRFVRDGGWLIAGGEAVVPLTPFVVGRALRWSSVGVAHAAPAQSRAAIPGVGRVDAARLGTWADLAQTTPLLIGNNRALATIATVGRGRVVLFADPSPLQNRLLDHADNAALALAVVGDRPVRFAEGVHGFSGATGLGAIPDRWKLALAGLTLAALVGMVAAGRRLGPPEDHDRELAPPRRAYVDALGAALARTGAPTAALEPVQRAAREALARRAGLTPDADTAALVAAAGRLAWPDDEVAALWSPPAGRDDILAVGRALARAYGEDQ